jgi:hypothetical protein
MFLNSFIVEEAFSSLTSQIITTAPSSAKRFTAALPIPCAPPVITATLFSNLLILFLS